MKRGKTLLSSTLIIIEEASGKVVDVSAYRIKGNDATLGGHFAKMLEKTFPQA